MGRCAEQDDCAEADNQVARHRWFLMAANIRRVVDTSRCLASERGGAGLGPPRHALA